MSVWANRLKGFSFVFSWRLRFYILHVSPRCLPFELVFLQCNLSSGSFVIFDRCPIALVPLISSPAPWTASVCLSKSVEHPCKSVPGFSTLPDWRVYCLRAPLIFQYHTVSARATCNKTKPSHSILPQTRSITLVHLPFFFFQINQVITFYVYKIIPLAFWWERVWEELTPPFRCCLSAHEHIMSPHSFQTSASFIRNA